jgi:hypothetical protein
MSGVRAVAAAVMLFAAVGAGCTASMRTGPAPTARSKPVGQTAVGGSLAQCDPAGTTVWAGTGQPRAGSLWPELVLARQGPAVAAQAVDPAAGLAYVLVSRTVRGLRGPFVLECINLQTGAVRHGPVFPAGGVTDHSLVTASGSLWVSLLPATSSQPVVMQVALRTLAVIRSLRLPTVPFAGCPCVSIAAGPAGSVWIGSFHTLLRVSIATGATLRDITLPAGNAAARRSRSRNIEPSFGVLP